MARARKATAAPVVALASPKATRRRTTRRVEVGDHVIPHRPRYTSFGYKVVRTARENQWAIPPDLSEDWHLIGHLDTLRRLSQGMYREFSQYRGMVSTLVNNVVGTGFGLQARTQSPELNIELERIWERWAHEPEVTGRYSWAALQARAFFLQVVDGDCLIVKTNRGRLQIVEAAQLDSATKLRTDASANTETVLGVERDMFGVPVAYYIRTYKNGTAIGDPIRIPADSALHVAEFERPSVSRGVPIAISALSDSHRLKDVFDSSAAAWVLQSRMALGLQTEDARAFAGSIGDSEGIDANSLASRFVNIGEGTIAVLGPDEEIKPIDQNRPGQNFENGVMAFMRPIAMAFGMPLELATLDFSRMNYSSARAAMEQARRGFEVRQANLEAQLHRPTYEWVIEQALIDAGREDLLLREDLFDHEWIKPPWPWIDPAKEIEALGDEMQMGMKTHAEVLKARGVEREQWINTRSAEVQNALEVEDLVIQRTGRDDLRGIWRMFAGLAFDSQTSAAMIQSSAMVETAEIQSDGQQQPNEEAPE